MNYLQEEIAYISVPWNTARKSIQLTTTAAT